MIWIQEDFKLDKRDALIIVDVQNDFYPGGALPVPKADQVIPVLNDYIRLFKKANARIFATRDWHPPNHTSFEIQGGPWPPHCIRDTEGAKFHSDLKISRDVTIVSKAIEPNKEGYSGFDNTELANTLKKEGIKRLFVGGLATEYCVKNTVLDSLKLGLKTVLLLDAIRGINTEPNNAAKAIDKMVSFGAKQATLTNFPYVVEVPSTDDFDDELYEKPLEKSEMKKKARMRPKGPYKRIKTERG